MVGHLGSLPVVDPTLALVIHNGFMGNTRKPMRIASFKLPEDLDQALTDLARARQTTRSALVREALTALAGQAPKSVVDLAGGLVGCLSGPADLSTSRRHMEDFGK